MNIKDYVSRLRWRFYMAIARWACAKIGHIPQNEFILRRLCGFRLSMSYNDSYFGEPKGLLKGLVAEIDRKLPPRSLFATKGDGA